MISHEREMRAGATRIIAPMIAALVLAGLATMTAFGCGYSDQGIPGASGGAGPGQKCSQDEQCDDDNPCTVDACSSEGLCEFTASPDGPAPEQIVGDCKTVQCAAGKAATEDDD